MIIKQVNGRWRVYEGEKELSTHDGLIGAIREANKQDQPYRIELEEV